MEVFNRDEKQKEEKKAVSDLKIDSQNILEQSQSAVETKPNTKLIFPINLFKKFNFSQSQK